MESSRCICMMMLILQASLSIASLSIYHICRDLINKWCVLKVRETNFCPLYIGDRDTFLNKKLKVKTRPLPSFKKLPEDWGDGQVVNDTSCSSKGSKFCSQYPCGDDSQPPVIPASGVKLPLLHYEGTKQNVWSGHHLLVWFGISLFMLWICFFTTG